MNNISAPVFDISRSSLSDGPGIRTVVYLKGCPLHCIWCHNPESLRAQPELMYYPERCIKCGRCLNICESGHQMSTNGMELLRNDHAFVYPCAEICPNMALQICGKIMDASEVIDEVIKDMHYYCRSGGGVTFSGGECLLYPEFVAAAGSILCAQVVHTCVESSLTIPWRNVEMVLPSTKLFLVDIKHPNDEMHKKLTGVGNTGLIENLRRLAKTANEIWIRIPLIPGCNDSESELLATAAIISSIGGAIKQVQLLKYNNLAKNKYAALGKEMQYYRESTQTDEAIESVKCLIAGRLPENIEILDE